ncbi:MAG TPA: D-alanine--D-alanine ligase [Pseudomonadales bacterium]
MKIDQHRIRGTVAVLFGGASSERDVSLKSGQAVIDAMSGMGLDVVAIDTEFQYLGRALQQHAIKHCFNILHGGPGENGEVQALLHSMGISCTGSGVLGCALAMDKQRSKLLWRGAGLPTADFLLVNEQTRWTDVVDTLGDKVMIKPSCEGSSIGMSVVESEQQFAQSLDAALKYDDEVLAEKWIDGPEYTVAILGERALPVIRLETDHQFYDYQAKYLSDSTRYLCPCGLSEELEQQVQQLALRAFAVLGCSGWGRIDVMQDRDGKFYLLEANTVPGMTDHSLVPMAAAAAGIGFDQLVADIFNQSLL